MTASKTQIVAIGGPTASGKSSLAMALGGLIPVELLNFDSMQIYRGMDIGTAKPGKEDRETIPHHLLDIRDPDELFSVGQYTPLFRDTVEDIASRGPLPVAVGGTGLYLRGALGGLIEGPGRDDDLRKELKSLEMGEPGVLYRMLVEKDPETASRNKPRDMVRIIRALEVYELTGMSISELHREHSFRDRPFDAVIYCLNPERATLYRWVEKRVDEMMEDGLLTEVEVLRDNGYGRDLPSMKALGYRELLAHLDGETSLEEAVELIKRNTRRYAKRQITWFKGEKGVRWLDISHPDEIPSLAERIVTEIREQDAETR
ncbi:MAG: tRNA (adenosine(37)-N6)-dimethylallyltransferase MiaA [bacterium]|nr:tRNA (adenosine(37)-N6)-dimethylallyltransferase MiaA [bacterium]